MLSPFMEYVCAMWGKPNFAQNVADRMALEDKITIGMLCKEEEKTQAARKEQLREIKRKGCPRCPHSPYSLQFVAYPICGVRVEMHCGKCRYIEIF